MSRTIHSSPARSRGRPAMVPQQDVRERLLDAATTLFAEYGVAATTMSRIAAQVGVTSAMVHYYFKNREQLLDAVAAERMQRFIDSVWGPVEMVETSAVGQIEGIIQRLIQAAEQMPWMPPLWLHEVLNEGGLLRERMFQRVPFEKLGVFAQSIRAGQQRGEINPQIEPGLVFMSILGLTMLPLASRKIWQNVLPLQHVDDQCLAQHITALLVQGMRGVKTQAE